MIPVYAQIDLSGVWTPRYHEDQQDRVPGPMLGDYLGLPINESARLSALSWDASRLTLPEEQCRVHAAPYIYHGPLAFRSWEEKDPQTQRLVAIKQYTGTYEQLRTIWMDGRAHPPAHAMHTWMGFSTGKWEGAMLTVTTTHIKQDWLRRNGVPQSDRTTMTEHFIRHGNVLTHMAVITDPAYLSEPFVRTEDFVLDLSYQGTWLYPCEPVVEVANRRKREVPMYMPGENPFVTEFQTRFGISAEAAMGGAATTYPEFRLGGTRPTAPIERLELPKSTNAGVQILPVQGNISMLVGPQSNAVVQVGPQGVLLVDTMTAGLSSDILSAVAKLSEKKLQYIINTSVEDAHTGGNDALRRAGGTVMDANAPGSFMPTDTASGAAIIAHENVLKRMSASQPFGTWPTSTFFGDDEKSLHFNGEGIRIIPQPAANTDGNVMVYFRRSDVIVTGDVFRTDLYPVIDLARGGSVQGVIDALNHVIDLAVPAHHEEGGTLIIPGHGRLCDRSDVVVYRDMLTIVHDRIVTMIRRGMSLEQVKTARPTLDYDLLYGDNEAFITAVYQSVAR